MSLRAESDGYRLINELLELIRDGKALSMESEWAWDNALVGLLTSTNKEDAIEELAQRLNLEFKTGKPSRSREFDVFRIETLVLTGMTKAKAFESLADITNLDETTIRDVYYRYRKARPEQYKYIKSLAKQRHEEGKGMVNPIDLAFSVILHNPNI